MNRNQRVARRTKRRYRRRHGSDSARPPERLVRLAHCVGELGQKSAISRWLNDRSRPTRASHVKCLTRSSAPSSGITATGSAGTPAGGRIPMMRRFFRWFFENRETGAITIAQAPNLSLWIVIVTGALIWGHPPGQVGVALKVIFSAALFVWAGDEILRGVNPWRRCLGVAMLCYWLWTLPR
jgi:hypothetical protein